jgi:precorrin-3B synthase
MMLLAAPMQRRRACPGLSAPMQTGDGLLVRLVPRGTISLPAFAELCAAARCYGNGVLEITSRGSIQVRGLSVASAPQFAAAIAALDIAAEDGVPILCNPLAGLDAEEIFDARCLAADLRQAIARRSLPARLSPKTSVLIDGAGAVGLEAIAADIRLRAQATHGHATFHVGIGGDQARAAQLGQIASAQAVEAVIRLLEVIAQRGRDVRVRDILARDGIETFLNAIGDLLVADPGFCLGGNQHDVALGSHRLRDGTMACGVAIAFGHTDAGTLEELVAAAKRAGASSLLTAPRRVLLTIGLAPELVSTFASAAGQLGFAVSPDDPRLKVIACAGAPFCASAHLASRALAPVIAAKAADFARTIHISGCAKGCAQSAATALTIVGTTEGCALIADGSPADMPFAVVSAGELPDAVRHYTCELGQEGARV